MADLEAKKWAKKREYIPGWSAYNNCTLKLNKKEIKMKFKDVNNDKLKRIAKNKKYILNFERNEILKRIYKNSYLGMESYSEGRLGFRFRNKDILKV